MTWLQIELRAKPHSLPIIEDVLLACGAVSITLLSDTDEPVLEPDPGQTPLWTSVRVQALFGLDIDMAVLRQAIAGIDASAIDELAVQFVNAQDWQDAARSYAVNQVFGERLWLLPKNAADEAGAGNLVRLYLEPGLAFGSGSHATTSLCLEWLATHIAAGDRVLDFGCGSGVLGIAAGLLGAAVIAVDHDPQAVMATRENAAYNGLSENRLTTLDLHEWQAEQHIGFFDVVVANILAGPLTALAREFQRVARPGAAVVLSGVLQEQAEEVMSSYSHTRFQPPVIEAGWACLIGMTHNRASG